VTDEAAPGRPSPSPPGRQDATPQRGGSFRRRTLLKAALAAGPVVTTIRSRPALARGGDGDKGKNSAKLSARLSSKPK